MHRARTVHVPCLLFISIIYMTDCFDACCPLRCCAIDLLPHFTRNAMSIALYMFFIGL